MIPSFPFAYKRSGGLVRKNPWVVFTNTYQTELESTNLCASEKIFHNKLGQRQASAWKQGGRRKKKEEEGRRSTMILKLPLVSRSNNQVLKLSLCYVSGIVSMSLHIIPCLGIVLFENPFTNYMETCGQKPLIFYWCLQFRLIQSMVWEGSGLVCAVSGAYIIIYKL